MLDYNISVMDCWRVDLLQLSRITSKSLNWPTPIAALYTVAQYNTRLGLGDFAIRL